MATVKEAIYTILQNDAKLHTGTELGSLLGRYDTSPYGVYLNNPPEEIDFSGGKSAITYSVISQSGRVPREIYYAFKAWGSNFEAVLDRVHALLNETQITATDFSVLMLKWDWAGPEIWDQRRRVYVCQHRYLAKAVKS